MLFLSCAHLNHMTSARLSMLLVYSLVQLLLLEVDEAEELAQEEHVAEWSAQDAAEAAQLLSDPNQHPNGTTTAADASGSEAAYDCGATDTASSVVGSMASTAVAALNELGPSVSGTLSNSSSSLQPAGEASHEHECADGSIHEHVHELVDAVPTRSSHGSSAGGSSNSSSSVGRPTPAAAAAAAGAQVEAAVAAVAAATARLGSAAPAAAAAASPAAVAAVAVRGLVEADDSEEPSSPSLASWRRSPDEVAVQDQGSQTGESDNPFVTITGAFNSQGYDPAVAAALAAAAASGPAAVGSRAAGSNLGGSPEKARKMLARGSNSSSSISSKAPAQQPSAAAAVVAAAVAAGEITAAEDVAALAAAAATDDANQQEQQQRVRQLDTQQQQQQSWLSSCTNWASGTWNSQQVQVRAWVEAFPGKLPACCMVLLPLLCRACWLATPSSS